jgi:hypothetical protein
LDMAQQNAVKLTYQLKKAEGEIEAFKKKEKVKLAEFLALQQGVTNKQKMLQQRINRLTKREREKRKRKLDLLFKGWSKSFSS